jgi:hypothetical protein
VLPTTAADLANPVVPDVRRVGVLWVAELRQLGPMIGTRAALGLRATEWRVSAAGARAAGWIGDVVLAEISRIVSPGVQQLAAVGAAPSALR